MKKVLAFVGIAVLITSVAAAEINPSAAKVINQGGATGTRTNGALGSVTIAAQQVGALQVQLDATATTQGGDGVPLVTIFNSITYTLNDQIWLYGQIYDSPWNGGCTFWTTNPGTDWCAFGEEFFHGRYCSESEACPPSHYTNIGLAGARNITEKWVIWEILARSGGSIAGEWP